jgi:CrcB protein
VSSLALWLAVGALGGAASLARFLLDGVLSAAGSGRFPIGTLAVNLSGTVVLGLLVGVGLHGDAYLLAGTAAIGSYTTFSTWMLESQRLAEDGARWIAALNLVLSLVLGVGAVALGRLLGGG